MKGSTMTDPYLDGMSKFWRKVDRSAECWIWKGQIREQRRIGIYGINKGNPRPYYSFKGKAFLAYRISLRATGIRVPEFMTVDHSCNNSLCVNPKHLGLAGPEVNTQMLSIRDPGSWPRTFFGESALLQANMYPGRRGTRLMAKSMEFMFRRCSGCGEEFCLIDSIERTVCSGCAEEDLMIESGMVRCDYCFEFVIEERVTELEDDIGEVICDECLDDANDAIGDDSIDWVGWLAYRD